MENNNINNHFSSSVDSNSQFSNILNIQDISYCQFMAKFNGGMFFEDALMFYPETGSKYSLIDLNLYLMEKFSFLTKETMFFAQDIFGNQFCFKNNQIFLFFIESGELEYVANKFNEFLEILEEEYDYLTGVAVKKEWEDSHVQLKFGERLCPKKPFILGGGYELDNFYNIETYNNLDYNSNIAIQLYGIPDKTKVKISFK